MLTLSTLLFITGIIAILMLISGFLILVIGDQFAQVLGLKLLGWGISVWIVLIVVSAATQYGPHMMQGN